MACLLVACLLVACLLFHGKRFDARFLGMEVRRAHLHSFLSPYINRCGSTRAQGVPHRRGLSRARARGLSRGRGLSRARAQGLSRGRGRGLSRGRGRGRLKRFDTCTSVGLLCPGCGRACCAPAVAGPESADGCALNTARAVPRLCRGVRDERYGTRLAVAERS